MLTPGTVPAYLMVGRYTTSTQVLYTAYTSPDGKTWTAVPGSTQALAMTGPVLAGIAITSHNQGTASAVPLDPVAGTPPPLPPPAPRPTTPTPTHTPPD